MQRVRIFTATPPRGGDSVDAVDRAFTRDAASMSAKVQRLSSDGTPVDGYSL